MERTNILFDLIIASRAATSILDKEVSEALTHAKESIIKTALAQKNRPNTEGGLKTMDSIIVDAKVMMCVVIQGLAEAFHERARLRGSNVEVTLNVEELKENFSKEISAKIQEGF